MDSVKEPFTPRVLVIVPAYNEEKSIEKVARSLADSSVDCIIINDGSTDSTAEILRAMRTPHIDLFQNLGIGGAVQTGYRYASQNGYDIAVQFDGDGQHDVAYIKRIIEPIICGDADIVVGSRFVGTESLFKSSCARRAGITVLSFILKLVSGQRVRDITSGFRAVNRDVIKLFANSYPSDYPEPESLGEALAHGFTVVEVPVAMHERQGGQSSIQGLSTLYYMVKVGLSIVLTSSFRKSKKEVSPCRSRY